MANAVLSRQFGEKKQPAVDGAMSTAQIPDSPVSGDVMTIGGSIRATGFLFLLLVAGGVYGWTLVEPSTEVVFPGWLIFAVLGALAVALVTIFKPNLARITGPIYAVAEGVVLGAITRVYESAWEGIAIQAVLATFATFAVMLVLYVTRTIRVTEKTRSVIIGATVGIFAFYMVSLLLSLFGASVPLVWDGGAVGILFSAFVVVVASFNLLLDFDLIERGAASRAPAYMDWYAAFGLMVTVVWIYLEMLRLLSKIRSN